MTLFDHLFMLAVFAALPVASTLSHRAWVRRIEAGEHPQRLKAYLQTMAWQWSALVALLAFWFWQSRPLADLGFRAIGGWGFWLGCLALVLMIGFSLHGWTRLRQASEDDRQAQRQALGKLVHMLPHNRAEFRGFLALSLTAGTVEEIIFRGFAFWYLSSWLPLWAVVLVTSLAFALAHLYQGVGNATRVFGIGLVFGVFYPLTGSIWLPMLGHALFDMLQGLMVLELLRDRDDRPAAPATA